MADVPVNLRVKADGRDVEKLSRQIGKTFDPKVVEKLGRAQGDLLKQITKLTQEQGKLNKELDKVQRGTERYKQLRQEVKSVRQEADMAAKSFKQIQSIVAGTGGGGGGAAGGAGGRGGAARQGFIGGLAQGAGVAQYIPSGPGQGARIGGAMLGRGMQQTVGAGRYMGRMAAAPFQMPGAAGVSTALGMIPIIGPAMAGAMQAGLGMYQQAAGYSRVKRQALFAQGEAYSGPQMAVRRAMYEARARSVEAAGRRSVSGAAPSKADLHIIQTGASAMINQSVAALQKMQSLNPLTAAKGASGMVSTGAKVAGAVTGKMMAKFVPGWGELPQEMREKAVAGMGADLINVAQNVATMGGATLFGHNVTGEQLRSTGLGKEFGKGQKIGAAGGRIDQAQARQATIKSKVKSRAAALRAAGGRQRTGLPGMGEGIQFGLGPSEMMGQFAQMMQARGGTYDDVKTGDFKSAMAAGVRFGISAGQSGQFLRAGVAGGGGEGMGGGLAGTIRAAFVQGLQGSQISEYLSTLVQLTQQAEKQGVKINVKDFNRQSATLQMAGLQGLQASRVAGGLRSAGMQLSQRGVSSPMDVLMARAAGFDPAGGPESYAKAMNKLGGGMDTEMMNQLLGGITSGVAGFGPEMQGLLFRRALGKAGVQVGPGQASTLLEAYKSGGSVTGAGEAIAAGEGPVTGMKWVGTGKRRRQVKTSMSPAEWLAGEARAGVKRGAGLTVGAAGIEAGQIGAGQGMAGLATKLSRLTIQTANTMGNFSKELGQLTGYVSEAVTAFRDFTKGGFAATLAKMFGFGPTPSK